MRVGRGAGEIERVLRAARLAPLGVQCAAVAVCIVVNVSGTEKPGGGKVRWRIRCCTYESFHQARA